MLASGLTGGRRKKTKRGFATSATYRPCRGLSREVKMYLVYSVPGARGALRGKREFKPQAQEKRIITNKMLLYIRVRVWSISQAPASLNKTTNWTKLKSPWGCLPVHHAEPDVRILDLTLIVPYLSILYKGISSCLTWFVGRRVFCLPVRHYKFIIRWIIRFIYPSQFFAYRLNH